MNVSKAEAVCKCGNLALAAKKSFEKIDALITKQPNFISKRLLPPTELHHASTSAIHMTL